MRAGPFVLDLDSNPHPRMLAEALELRHHADDLAAHSSVASELAAARWAGYRQAMIAATGCAPSEIDAWVDRHDPRRP